MQVLEYTQCAQYDYRGKTSGHCLIFILKGGGGGGGAGQSLYSSHVICRRREICMYGSSAC